MRTTYSTVVILLCAVACLMTAGCNPTGALVVNLSPQAAIDAGAQWQVDGGTWQVSGSTLAGIKVGERHVTFKDVVGWTTPASLTKVIEAKKTIEVAVEYLPSGEGEGEGELPQAPAGLKAISGVSQIVLRWTPNADPYLRGYMVYRAKNGSGPFAALTSSTVSDPRYTDKTVTANSHYWYQVAAVRASDEGPRSTPVEAVAGGVRLDLPVMAIKPDSFARVPISIDLRLSGRSSSCSPF